MDSLSFQRFTSKRCGAFLSTWHEAIGIQFTIFYGRVLPGQSRCFTIHKDLAMRTTFLHKTLPAIPRSAFLVEYQWYQPPTRTKNTTRLDTGLQSVRASAMPRAPPSGNPILSYRQWCSCVVAGACKNGNSVIHGRSQDALVIWFNRIELISAWVQAPQPHYFPSSACVPWLAWSCRGPPWAKPLINSLN